MELKLSLQLSTAAQISGRLTPGFIPLLYYKCGGEPRDKPGGWRPEMWAMIDLRSSCVVMELKLVHCIVYFVFSVPYCTVERKKSLDF
jgi:hypothetical protein